MVNGNQQSPDGWEMKDLGDLVSFVGSGITPKGGKNVYQKQGVPFIRSQNVYPDGLRLDDVAYVTLKLHAEMDRTHVRAGDVLLNITGASIGRSTFVPESLGEANVNQHVCILRPLNLITPKFLSAFLNSNNGQDQIMGAQSGVTRQGLNYSQVRALRIPVPPLPEQERIVAKIEELFTQLEAGTSALERVQAGLRRYKASVLKAAVEGKLRIQKDEFRIGEGELPEGWRWTTVEELAAKERNSITDGPFGSKLKTEHYKESGPRVIRLQNIGDGEFRDEKAHISQEHFETLRKHQIFAGDLVIAGLGESLPRACMIPQYVGDAIVKADCIRFKPNSEIADNKYLLYALNSETVKKLVAKVVHGIGRPRMNQQEIKSIPIPLPPLEEQRRIVAEVERRLSVAREVESAVEVAPVRASRLRQAGRGPSPRWSS